MRKPTRSVTLVLAAAAAVSFAGVSGATAASAATVSKAATISSAHAPVKTGGTVKAAVSAFPVGNTPAGLCDAWTGLLQNVQHELESETSPAKASGLAAELTNDKSEAVDDGCAVID